MPLTPPTGPAGRRRRRAWFGPSRRGWGLWPRAWQGWVVTALGVAVIAVLVVLAAH